MLQRSWPAIFTVYFMSLLRLFKIGVASGATLGLILGAFFFFFPCHLFLKGVHTMDGVDLYHPRVFNEGH